MLYKLMLPSLEWFQNYRECAYQRMHNITTVPIGKRLSPEFHSDKVYITLT
jgi:hypothetical protein